MSGARSRLKAPKDSFCGYRSQRVSQEVPLPGLKRSVRKKRRLLISAFLPGLHRGHVLSAVLAR